MTLCIIIQRVGDEGGICVVAESCHQTSEGIGLMASANIAPIPESNFGFMVSYLNACSGRPWNHNDYP